MLQRLVVSVSLAGVVASADFSAQLHAQDVRQDPACEQLPGEDRGAVVGRITDTETGLPLQEAEAQLEWQEASGRRGKIEVETDDAGSFRACSLPAGRPINLTARFGRANDRQGIKLASGETHSVAIQLDAPRSRAAGRVVEHGSSRGISDAELRITGSNVRAVSGADGSFRLPDVPAGRYLLETSHLGFGTRTDTVAVEFGSIMVYTIGLSPAAIPHRPIEVAVRSLNLERRGFYQRQARGYGSFLTQHDWSARDVGMPSELLRTVPGVRISPRRGGFGNILFDRSSCPFRYVIDGVHVGDSFLIDELRSDWIEAVEIYRGIATVPMEFRAPPTSARANCGVIVVWLRAGR